MKALKILLFSALVLSLCSALYAKPGTDKRDVQADIGYSSDLISVSSFDMLYVSELTAMEVVPQWIEKEIGETAGGYIDTVFHPPALWSRST